MSKGRHHRGIFRDGLVMHFIGILSNNGNNFVPTATPKVLYKTISTNLANINLIPVRIQNFSFGN